MRITIVGTGAMACLFGARLAAVAPHAVTLTGTWLESLAAIRRRGVVLVDEAGIHPYPIQAVPLGYPTQPAEIVLLLVKSWQTEASLPHLAGLLKPGGVVISLQQSLGNLERLGETACLGYTDFSALLVEPGYVRASQEEPLDLAAPAWVVEVFRHAGFAVEPQTPTQVQGRLWGTVALRCGLEALTAILQISYAELLARPDAVTLMDRAAMECAMVAWAQGLSLPFADPILAAHKAAQQLGETPSPVWLDLRRGTPTEIDGLNGAVVREGSQRGVRTGANEALWRLVRALAAKPPRPADD